MAAKKKPGKKGNGKAEAIEGELLPGPGGRPLVTLAEAGLPEDWMSQIIERYREGAKDIEIRAMIHGWRGSFSQALWDRWLVDEPEFSITIKAGRELAHAWWAHHLRKQAEEGVGNVTATIFAMTNMYPDEYKRRQEVGGHVEHTHRHTAISELERRTLELAGEPAN